MFNIRCGEIVVGIVHMPNYNGAYLHRNNFLPLCSDSRSECYWNNIRSFIWTLTLKKSKNLRDFAVIITDSFGGGC